MTGIIVTGHGHFPAGILSAVKLVAGELENITGIDFLEGQTSEELKTSLGKAIDTLKGNEILILADLAGGTPFNMAAVLKAERMDKGIKVVAGVNMAALVEAVFSRPVYGLEELAEASAAAGREAFKDLDALEDAEELPEPEDGL